VDFLVAVAEVIMVNMCQTCQVRQFNSSITIFYLSFQANASEEKSMPNSRKKSPDGDDKEDREWTFLYSMESALFCRFDLAPQLSNMKVCRVPNSTG
jgi:hypothetical protein